jgi:hypothetical protein
LSRERHLKNEPGSSGMRLFGYEKRSPKWNEVTHGTIYLCLPSVPFAIPNQPSTTQSWVLSSSHSISMVEYWSQAVEGLFTHIWMLSLWLLEGSLWCKYENGIGILPWVGMFVVQLSRLGYMFEIIGFSLGQWILVYVKETL